MDQKVQTEALETSDQHVQADITVVEQGMLTHCLFLTCHIHFHAWTQTVTKYLRLTRLTSKFAEGAFYILLHPPPSLSPIQHTAQFWYNHMCTIGIKGNINSNNKSHCSCTMWNKWLNFIVLLFIIAMCSILTTFVDVTWIWEFEIFTVCNTWYEQTVTTLLMDVK